MSEEIDQHVLRKYEVLQRLGRYVVSVISLTVNIRGAYGIVWKAVARKNNQVVALKKCFDAFQNSTGMNGYSFFASHVTNRCPTDV
jgi:mitogen-activated protein kinase 15